MAGGIIKANTETMIPPVPPLPPSGVATGSMIEASANQQSSGNHRNAPEEDHRILERIRQLEAEAGTERDRHEEAERDFQRERETLTDTIAELEAKLRSGDPSESTRNTELLIARITAESVAAATTAAMTTISANATLNKNGKKYALAAVNYVAAEAVERSGVIPEIVLRTARKGFFIPFSDLTASQYRDYALNDRTIKKVTRAVEGRMGLIEAEYVDDLNSDARDRNLPKHEWLEAQTRFLQLLQMDGVADNVTVDNFRHLYQFIKDHSLWDFNFPVLARAEHTLRRKFFTSPFLFADMNLEREVQDAQTAFNQEKFQLLAERTAKQSDLYQQQSQLRVPRERGSSRYEPMSRSAERPSPYSKVQTQQREHTKPFRGSNERSNPEARCWCCGRVGHRATDCTVPTNAGGGPLRSRNINGKVVRISDSKEYCYYAHIGRSCAKPNCRLLHECSICGGSDHGAQSASC